MMTPREMAESHWCYVKSVILNHVPCSDETIRLCKFHYITAFIHGYGHGLEAKGKTKEDFENLRTKTTWCTGIENGSSYLKISNEEKNQIGFLINKDDIK